MERRLAEHIVSTNLFSHHHRLLVAVSGGVDSMVLASLLHTLSYPIGVAHVNYRLRGVESDADRDLVASWCKKERIDFHLLETDAKQVADENNEGIQVVARRLRYAWFDEVAQSETYDFILTAHHADDNFETALYHLVKGTGIRGVRGILPKKNRLVRPLLPFSRQEILEYARQAGIGWREDASNQQSAYSRNFLRNEIVPSLRRINPSLSENFFHTHQRFVGMEMLLNERLEQLTARYVSMQNGRITIDGSWVGNSAADVLLLHELIVDYGFSYRQSVQVHAALFHTSGQLFYSRTHVLNVDRHSLLIEPVTDKEERTVYEIDEQTTHVSMAAFDLHVASERVSGLTISKDPAIAFLDLDALRFPLVIRQWKKGDVFCPLGMQKHKKISDFLIDQKVPVVEKKNVFVVCSGEDICWVVGYRIDDRYKLQPDSQRSLVIEKRR